MNRWYRTFFLEPAWRFLLTIDDRPHLRRLAGYFAHGLGLGCGSVFALPWRNYQEEALCDRVAGHALMHRSRLHYTGWSTVTESYYQGSRPRPIAEAPCAR